MILQDLVIRGEGAKGEVGFLLKMFFLDLLEEFLGDHIVEASVEVIEIEGGIAILLSEHSSDVDGFESITDYGPFVAKSDHIFDALFTFLLE